MTYQSILARSAGRLLKASRCPFSRRFDCETRQQYAFVVRSVTSGHHSSSLPCCSSSGAANSSSSFATPSGASSLGREIGLLARASAPAALPTSNRRTCHQNGKMVSQLWYYRHYYSTTTKGTGIIGRSKSDARAAEEDEYFLQLLTSERADNPFPLHPPRKDMVQGWRNLQKSNSGARKNAPQSNSQQVFAGLDFDKKVDNSSAPRPVLEAPNATKANFLLQRLFAAGRRPTANTKGVGQGLNRAPLPTQSKEREVGAAQAVNDRAKDSLADDINQERPAVADSINTADDEHASSMLPARDAAKSKSSTSIGSSWSRDDGGQQLNASPYALRSRDSDPDIVTIDHWRGTATRQGSGGGAEDGNAPKEKEKDTPSSSDNKGFWQTKKFRIWSVVLLGAAIVLYAIDAFVTWCKEATDVNFLTWFRKVYIDYYAEPSRPVLLPPPLPYPYHQPKYTLVMEMKNVLLKPEWTYATGWRFKKRPAIDYFLDVIGYPNFEVVIYTDEPPFSGDPLVQSCDPNQRIMYKCYRDTTKYTGGLQGHHVKMLEQLGRDMSKVIFIDYDAKCCDQPANLLLVKPWNGDMGDTDLVDLAEMLKTIFISDVDDVRPMLQYYSQFDDPAKEFRKRAASLAEQDAAKAKQDDKRLTQTYSGSLFGLGRHSRAH